MIRTLVLCMMVSSCWSEESTSGTSLSDIKNTFDDFYKNSVQPVVQESVAKLQNLTGVDSSAANDALKNTVNDFVKNYVQPLQQSASSADFQQAVTKVQESIKPALAALQNNTDSISKQVQSTLGDFLKQFQTAQAV